MGKLQLVVLENDSDYCILHLDDRKFKSHLLQVLLKNGLSSSDEAIVQKQVFNETKLNIV